MTKKEFKKLLQNRLILLDGGMGTLLQKAGMPSGVCPEKWATLESDLIKEIQRKYIEAGSDIIYTFTFGANPIKLSEYGIEDETYNLNKTLAEIARDAAGNDALVAGIFRPVAACCTHLGVSCLKKRWKALKAGKGLLDGGVDYSL